jgi:hypothetical protein
VKRKRYLTKGGIEVEVIGPEKILDGKAKVPCRRLRTGGWHGWLVLDRLTEIKGFDS